MVRIQRSRFSTIFCCLRGYLKIAYFPVSSRSSCAPPIVTSSQGTVHKPRHLPVVSPDLVSLLQAVTTVVSGAKLIIPVQKSFMIQ